MVQRDIISDVLNNINQQENEHSVLVFIDIKHRLLDDEINVVSNSVDCRLGNKYYIGYLFRITLLSDTENAPEARLTINNIDRRIGRFILQADERPPELTIRLVEDSQFNLDEMPHTEINPDNSNLIYNAPQLFLIDIEGDTMQISGRLVSWDYTQELWPGLRATQSRLPGLFR